MYIHTHTRNIRCIFGVKITRVEAQQGQRPVRLWGERKRIAKSREREREREGERSPLSRVCRGLRAVSGSGEGGGAAGEGRRASRRRLPHPAKRLLPLNRQNVYLTQPWRRRRRERASLPRHAVARRARFRCFHFSLPFRNPPRTASASVSAKVSPTIPPCVYYTRENQLFLPSPLLRVCVRKYIYVYVCVCISVCVRACVCVVEKHLVLWLGPCSCADTRQRGDSHAEEGERKGSEKEKELGGGGEEVS